MRSHALLTAVLAIAASALGQGPTAEVRPVALSETVDVELGPSQPDANRFFRFGTPAVNESSSVVFDATLRDNSGGFLPNAAGVFIGSAGGANTTIARAATSGSLGPGLAPGIEVSSFVNTTVGIANLNDLDEAVFLANLTGPGISVANGNTQAILATLGGSLATVAQSNTPGFVTGGSFPDRFSAGGRFFPAAINNSSDIAITVGAGGGIGPTSNRIYYRPAGQLFESLAFAAGQPTLAINGRMHCEFAGGTPEGLLRVTPGVAPVLLLQSARPGLGTPIINDPGSDGFGGVSGDAGFAYSANHAGDVAIVAGIGSQAITNSNGAIYFWNESTGQLSLVARQNTAGVLGPRAGALFEAQGFGNVQINASRQIAFSASFRETGIQNPPLEEGIFLWENGAITPIALSNDPAYTVDGVRFSSFAERIILNNNGVVVFEAGLDSPQNEALVAYSGGKLLLLARESRTIDLDPGAGIDERTVSGNLINDSAFRMSNGYGPEDGGPTSLNEQNELAVRLVFTNGSQSIVLFDIPTPCNDLDLALPFGRLDFFDFTAYLRLFLAGDPAADLFPVGTPDGLFTADDVQRAIAIINGGC